MNAHIVSLEPLPIRGNKAIMVDGLRWGTIHMETHGCWGSSYWFNQTGIQGQQITSGDRPVKVYGDKGERRRLGTYDAVAPVAERLHAKATELIASGLLRHPDSVKAEQAERAARWRASEAERDCKATDRLRAKAREALGDGIGENELTIIVGLMKWAQSITR
jgi:hypothetical protein